MSIRINAAGQAEYWVDGVYCGHGDEGYKAALEALRKE